MAQWHPTCIKQLQLDFATESFAYRSPMKFGGRVVRDVTLVNVVCRVTNHTGQIGVGLGSMTMGNVWSWPSSLMNGEQTLAAIVELARRLTKDCDEQCLSGHPLEICWIAAQRRSEIAVGLQKDWDLPESVPALAQLLASSPLEAAIFDAHGKAANRSSYQLLGAEYLAGDLSRFLGDEFKGRTLDEFILPTPVAAMPLYHLVGALDALDERQLMESQTPANLDDGLPSTLAGWIEQDGLTHLKVKLDGADADWDLQRVLEVNRVADQGPRGADAPWSFSLDFNERCQNEEYVLRLLDGVAQRSVGALNRLAYIEQPTHRDLKAHPENTMHRVAARLPVVIDEALIDYESLLLAREQGYSGVALKACKGHSEALLMAAAAQFHQMYLCVQDLTCVGASFLHSASLTAHLPGAAAIEGNGRQYCPEANRGWESCYPGMFDVRNGRLPTHLLSESGLGYHDGRIA